MAAALKVLGSAGCKDVLGSKGRPSVQRRLYNALVPLQVRLLHAPLA
jgi:hypothetical protein